MSKPIVVVGGGKGGVGKSTVSIGVIDTLLAHGENVQLIESDTSNPDVWKMYRNEIETCLINLDDANGWIDLVNVCDDNPESVVVLNTAARNNRGVAAYGDTLNSTLADLKRDLITIWVINRQRDSLELLNQYMAALTGSRIHVMRNGYFGDEQKFELYNEWLVLMALESYDTLYRRYPAIIDTQLRKSLEDQRAAIAVIADAETKKALGTLAQAVCRTSEKVALRLTQASWMLWCGLAMLAMVMFGSFCTLMGYVLGSGRLPYWASPVDHASFAGLVFSALARTPAGWVGAIAGISMALAAACHARQDGGPGSRRIAAGCGALILLCLAFLWPALQVA